MANILKNEPNECNIEFQSIISSYLVTIFPKDLHEIFLEYIKFGPISCKDFDNKKLLIINHKYDNKYYFDILYYYFENTFKQLYLHTQWLKLDVDICNLEKIYPTTEVPDNSTTFMLKHQDGYNAEFINSLTSLEREINKIQYYELTLPFFFNNLDNYYHITVYFKVIQNMSIKNIYIHENNKKIVEINPINVGQILKTCSKKD